jgi:hypothetical protein
MSQSCWAATASPSLSWEIQIRTGATEFMDMGPC